MDYSGSLIIWNNKNTQLGLEQHKTYAVYKCNMFILSLILFSPQNI